MDIELLFHVVIYCLTIQIAIVKKPQDPAVRPIIRKIRYMKIFYS